MQFTLRQLLLFVTGLSAWFGMIAQGHCLFGGFGAVVFGVFFGIAIFFLVRMVVCWSRWSSKERGACALVLLLSVSGGLYLTYLAFNYGFHLEQEQSREANRLQAELHADSRYQFVVVTYETHRKGSMLRLGGSVTSQDHLDSLHRMVNDEDRWFVSWNVDVISKRPRATNPSLNRTASFPALRQLD